MEIIGIDSLNYVSQDKETIILKNINLQIKRGEYLGIMGNSGSGKSSLCLAIKGILSHYYSGRITGEIWVDGQEISQYSPAQLALKIGMVFQDPDTQLFSPTVEDELAFAPENLCMAVEEIKERIDQALEIVGMEEYRYHAPQELSGGQKQLVALAAVLTLDPEILIFDEPTAQLDPKERLRVREIVGNLHRRGKTIILVEHNLELLEQGQKIVILDKGELIRIGAVKEILLDLELLDSYGLPQPFFPLFWKLLDLEAQGCILDWREGYQKLKGMLKHVSTGT